MIMQRTDEATIEIAYSDGEKFTGSGYLISIDTSIDRIDVTAFGDAARSFVAGGMHHDIRIKLNSLEHQAKVGKETEPGEIAERLLRRIRI